MLYRFTGGEPPGIRNLTERYRRQVVGRSPDGLEQWLNWILIEADATAPPRRRPAVGFVQATVSTTPPEDSAELAWLVSPVHQGHGLACEAAQAVLAWLRASGVTAFTAHIHPDHLASQAVARRLGFHPTTTFVDGENVWAS